jgi:hypothetical protein
MSARRRKPNGLAKAPELSKMGACFLPELAHQALSMKKLARTLKKGLFFSYRLALQSVTAPGAHLQPL